MSGMDGRAFGSPVAAATVATNACGSVGERVVRGSRIRLFQDAKESIQRSTVVPGTGTVELLGPGGNVVGTRVLQDNIKCGIELNAMKLYPFEVAVQVVQILDESMWTREIVGERLGQCVGFVIRWRRADVQSVSGGTSSVAESGTGQNFSFPSPVGSDFEFKDEDIGNGDSSDPSHHEEGTSAARSMSPMTEASQCTAGMVPVPDGLPIGGQSRRYSMRNRHTRATPVWGMGVRIQDRVKLDSVLEAKVRSGCLRNCLREVGERYILDQWYMAWAQKYEVRATWIMQMLNAFYQRTEGMRRDKYNTKLDGVEVYNACYAMALGYSQRRFKQLKVAYRVYGRVAAVHGNMCNLRERAKMSAAKESFTAFIGDAGCTQPHHQVRRKVDNSVVPLILLPMNTTKVDVFHFVNEEVKTLVGGESMLLASFHRLWRTKFSHVQISPFSRFSKCYHCWEYKWGMEATMNAAARL
jgi:hypothetical protein